MERRAKNGWSVKSKPSQPPSRNWISVCPALNTLGVNPALCYIGHGTVTPVGRISWLLYQHTRIQPICYLSCQLLVYVHLLCSITQWNVTIIGWRWRVRYDNYPGNAQSLGRLRICAKEFFCRVPLVLLVMKATFRSNERLSIALAQPRKKVGCWAAKPSLTPTNGPQYPSKLCCS